MCDEEEIFETFDEPKSKCFTIKNVYGFDKEIGISYYRNNLNESCIIYIVSNTIIVYNLTTFSYQYFSGHEEKIQLCKIDNNEKIMITADKESIFIWDLKANENSTDLTLLRILHEPFGEEDVDIAIAGLSSCGKYLIIISKINVENDNDDNGKKLDSVNTENVSIEKFINNSFLQFWKWSFGYEECNDLITLPPKYGQVKTITFNNNKNQEHYFALTFKNIVLFGNSEENGKIILHTPFNAHSRICNELNQTCYLENSQCVVSVTSKGRLIIWLNIEKSNSNDKNYFRMVQLRNCCINDIKNFDNLIVIADELGEIRFYNYNYLLMYVYTNDNIKLINILSLCPLNEKRTIEDLDENRSKYAKDLSREQNIFIVRKIFIVIETGNILLCDVTENNYNSILQINSDIKVAGDVFQKRLCTVSCLANGYVNIFNYKKNVLIGTNNLNQYYKTKKKPLITACKISPDELSIFVGMKNGDLWILDIITAKPTNSSPLQFTKNQIDIIVFHPTDNQYSAVATNNFTLCLLQYKSNNWDILSKHRYHCKPILNIFFLYINNINYLITIGHDRMYIKYDITLEDNNALMPVLDIRLDQIPKIYCAELFDSNILAIDTSRCGKVILTANDAYKFVFYDAFTAKRLFTFLGPVFDSPIKKILLIPSNDENSDSFLIMASTKTLGAALLPLDGNPFRYSGVKADLDKIERLDRTYDDSIVIHGLNNSGSYWWTLNKDVVKEKFLSHGDDLEPFCYLLPGGKTGWFFKEIQDYFFYLQLLVQERQDKREQFLVSDFMHVSEIPDFMRAIGYFPSEYEIKNFLSEVNDTNTIIIENIFFDENQINFTELVKLYINHKPVFGYPLHDIVNSVKYLKIINDDVPNENDEINKEFQLTLDDILNILTEKYEKITKLQAMKYLKELLKPNKYQNFYTELTENDIIKEFNQLKNNFTIFEFCNYLLGLDILQSPINENVSMDGRKSGKFKLKNQKRKELNDVESDLET